MKRLISVTIGLFAFSLPLQAVSQTLEDQFNRQNNQRKRDQWIHDCSHWDKAQYASFMPGSSLAVKFASILDYERVRIHPNGRVLKIKKGGLLSVREEPNECRGEFASWTGKIGSNRKMFSDGSGWEVLTKKTGPFLVSYVQSCSQWSCQGIPHRTFEGIELSQVDVIHQKCGKPEYSFRDDDPANICIRSTLSSLFTAHGLN